MVELNPIEQNVIHRRAGGVGGFFSSRRGVSVACLRFSFLYRGVGLFTCFVAFSCEGKKSFPLLIKTCFVERCVFLLRYKLRRFFQRSASFLDFSDIARGGWGFVVGGDLGGGV